MRYQRHCFVTHFWSCFRLKRRCLLGRIWIQRKDLKHCFFFSSEMLENLNETLRLCRSRCLAFMNYVCFYFSRIWFCFRASSGFIAVFFVPLVCAFFSLSLSLLFISLSFSPSFNVNSPELSSEHSVLNESNHRRSIYRELISWMCSHFTTDNNTWFGYFAYY